MCGIAGFFNPSADYTKEKNYRNHILEMMNQVQKHRGPDDEGTFLSPQCGLAHVRLNIIDLVTGHQPMRRVRGDHSCVIAYNGEIYNAPELKAELILYKKRRDYYFFFRNQGIVCLSRYRSRT